MSAAAGTSSTCACTRRSRTRTCTRWRNWRSGSTSAMSWRAGAVSRCAGRAFLARRPRDSLLEFAAGDAASGVERREEAAAVAALFLAGDLPRQDQQHGRVARAELRGGRARGDEVLEAADIR